MKLPIRSTLDIPALTTEFPLVGTIEAQDRFTVVFQGETLDIIDGSPEMVITHHVFQTGYILPLAPYMGS